MDDQRLVLSGLSHRVLRDLCAALFNMNLPEVRVIQMMYRLKVWPSVTSKFVWYACSVQGHEYPSDLQVTGSDVHSVVLRAACLVELQQRGKTVEEALAEIG